MSFTSFKFLSLLIPTESKRISAFLCCSSISMPFILKQVSGANKTVFSFSNFSNLEISKQYGTQSLLIL